MPLFQSESKCETILMKTTLICLKMKLHAELVLKQRHKRTRKWPIFIKNNLNFEIGRRQEVSNVKKTHAIPIGSDATVTTFRPQSKTDTMHNKILRFKII